MSLKVEKADQEPDTWFVTPTPGYVVKFKQISMPGDELEQAAKRKCFLNICHCTQLPPPVDDIDENALAALIDAGDYGFRVPLSIGELDCVRDNKNENSVKIDVLVNSVFYEKRLAPPAAEFYRHFLMMVVCEAIEKKHMARLDPNGATRLQNRRKMGDIEPMRIAKRPPAPVIQEVEDKATTPLSTKVEQIGGQNPFTSFPQPDGVSIRLLKGERLEIRMALDHIQPPVVHPKRLQLKLSSDRVLLLLDNQRSLYDFCVPFLVDPTTSRSKFSFQKKTLVVAADITFP